MASGQWSDLVPLEIERVFLLSCLPDLPSEAKALQMEQGYLPENGTPVEVGFAEGRIRRTVRPDGMVVCRHTIKRGIGLVREETERLIEESEFDRIWPSTEGRRISKTRYEVPHDDLIWEIDQFHGRDLVLAEVEMPTADHPVELPDWLTPCIVREVTEDPAYRNYALAVG